MLCEYNILMYLTGFRIRECEQTYLTPLCYYRQAVILHTVKVQSSSSNRSFTALSKNYYAMIYHNYDKIKVLLTITCQAL